jgi:hypothetical protein
MLPGVFVIATFTGCGQRGNIVQRQLLLGTRILEFITSDERQSISQFPAGQVYSHSINKVGDLVHQSFRNNIFVTYGIGGHYPTAVFRDGGEDYPPSREPIRPVTPPEEQDA